MSVNDDLDQNVVKSLLHAAERGDLKKTEHCLKSVPVDCIDDQSHTPLHFAAANGHEHIVRELIKKGAGLECQNWCGWSPIMFAAYYGHYNVVSILVQNNAEVNIPNLRMATPLTCASRCGHMGIIELLLKKGAQVNPKIESNIVPLMAAVQHGHTAIVSLLLQYGANGNFQNPATGYTALMLAACNGHQSIVELLIEKAGVNVNLTNILDQTAYTLSTLRKHVKLELYLSGRTQKIERKLVITEDSLIDAIKGGKFDYVKNELKRHRQIDVNILDSDGGTPLIYACMSGQYDLVQLLLKAGAEPDLQDKLHGWTALMQATLKRHVDIVKLLLRHGADINVQNFEGFLAFDLATLVGIPEVTRLLVPGAPGVKKDKEKDEKSNKNSIISMVSGKLGLKQRSSQVVSRVPIQTCDIVAGSTIGNDIVDCGEDRDALKKTSSVLSVLDAAMALKGSARARFTLVSPQVKLPDDVVAPVIAPYSKLPSFDLPKMPVITSSYSSSGSVSESSPNNSSDSMSLESMQQSNRAPRNALSRPQMIPNKPVPVPSSQNYMQDSPQSSLTSSGFTSVSQHRGGPGVMPSTKFKKLPALGVEFPQSSIAAWQLSNSNNSSFNQHMQQMVSRPPTKSRLNNLPSISNTDLSIKSVSDFGTNNDDVATLLSKLSLEKYHSTFEDEEVDMETLREMDDADLKIIGVDKTLYRKRILRAVNDKVRKSSHLVYQPAPPIGRPSDSSIASRNSHYKQYVGNAR